MRAAAGFGSIVLALTLGACQHDLDKLQTGLKGRGSVPLRDSGTPPSTAGRGEDAGVAGREGDGGRAGAGGSGGSVSPPATCEPCDELTRGAMQVGLRSCCRGIANRDCGLTFGEGAVCLKRTVPGKTDPECAAAMVGNMQLAGCCRPDGRCGLVADGLGLGCVARDELPRPLGGTAEPTFCSYECTTDDTCQGTASMVRCAENNDRSARQCALECQRDQDCPRGLVCALTNDLEMDRVLSICREPTGDGEFGEFCSAATDCISGVCLIIQDQQPYCSRLCKNHQDCPAVCFESQIQSPQSGQLQSFSICEK